MTYKFNNLTFKHDGIEYLASGVAEYTIDDFGDDDQEAGFETVSLSDAIGPKGRVPPEKLFSLSDSVLTSLNRNESLCRMLAR